MLRRNETIDQESTRWLDLGYNAALSQRVWVLGVEPLHHSPFIIWAQVAHR